MQLKNSLCRADHGAPGPRVPAVVLDSSYVEADAVARLGHANYSYPFAMRHYVPLLRRWGPVVEVSQPESRLDFQLFRLAAEGKRPLHLSFRPLHDVYLSRHAPNAAYVFWEFPDIPESAFGDNPRNDWVRVAGRLDHLFTASNFAREAFRRAGVTCPVHVIPVPVRPEYFAVPAWRPGQCVEIPTTGFIFPQATGDPRGALPFPWSDYSGTWPKVDRERLLGYYGARIKPHLPRRVARALRDASRRAGIMGPRMFRYPAVSPVRLSGVVYTTVLNPGDTRKNWHDTVTAFLAALGDREDAMLVTKLVVSPADAPANLEILVEYYRRLGMTHRAKVVFLPCYLTDGEMVDLLAGSTFLVSSSRAEGACLPLQDALAAGRPAVAPAHSSLLDYFGPEVGLVVDSCVEPTHFPHDPTHRYITTWRRLNWESLREQFRASYALATTDPGRYQALAERGRACMQAYASAEAVYPRLAAALEAVARDAEGEEHQIGRSGEGERRNPSVFPSPLFPVSPSALPPSRAPRPLYVEVSALLEKRLTGIGRCLARLLEALAPLTPLRLVTAYQKRLLKILLGIGPPLRAGWEIAVGPEHLPGPGADLERWAKGLLRLPQVPFDREGSRECPILFPVLRPGVRHFARELCLLHDFTPVLTPWAHRAGTCHLFGEFFADGTRLCDKAFAVSQSTRADAAWLAGIPHGDVVCAPNGPSQCVHGHAYPGDVRRRRDLILVVSTLEPRKNAPFLADWFMNTGVLGADTELWWVGPRGWLTHAALPGRKSGRGRRIRFLGMVSDAKLCRLYREAAFTIYPSLYEGFGLPVLDSLLHGAPVLCSLNSSLAEFAGPGVFYFDPCDPATVDEAYRELAAAMPVTIDADALRARFSWERAARCIVSYAFAGEAPEQTVTAAAG